MRHPKARFARSLGAWPPGCKPPAAGDARRKDRGGPVTDIGMIYAPPLTPRKGGRSGNRTIECFVSSCEVTDGIDPSAAPCFSAAKGPN